MIDSIIVNSGQFKCSESWNSKKNLILVYVSVSYLLCPFIFFECSRTRKNIHKNKHLRLSTIEKHNNLHTLLYRNFIVSSLTMLAAKVISYTFISLTVILILDFLACWVWDVTVHAQFPSKIIFCAMVCKIYL